MRTEEEVGGLVGYGEKANEAYRTYASLWLDFYDDHIDRLSWLKEWRLSISKDTAYETYLDKAAELAGEVLSSGYYSSMDAMYHDFPLLRERREYLESLFYEKEEAV